MIIRKKFFGFISIILGLMLTITPYARAVEIVVSDNGSGSNNEVSVEVETTTTVEQTNEANIANEVTTEANTGENEASSNTGGDVSIETGGIQEEVLIENSVNSSVVETECCPSETQAEISGNGSDSQNTVDLTQENETSVSVNQAATITNNIEGEANTGGNNANNNTDGSVSIETGNITVGSGIENDPVNTASVKVASGNVSVSTKISENGSGSENTIQADFENSTSTFLNFTADIDNFVNWDLNTGQNDANGNVGGDVSIKTGDISLSLFIKNLANLGGVEIDCCEIFDPGDGEEPSDGEEPPDEECPNGEEPSDNGDNGDGDDNGDDNDEEEGELLDEAAATEAGGPGIYGLSDTSSDLAQGLFFWAGMIMIATGACLIEREASSKISA